MHTLVKIVRLDCTECEGSGSIEMEIDRRADLAVAMVR